MCPFHCCCLQLTVAEQWKHIGRVTETQYFPSAGMSGPFFVGKTSGRDYELQAVKNQSQQSCR